MTAPKIPLGLFSFLHIAILISVLFGCRPGQSQEGGAIAQDGGTPAIERAIAGGAFDKAIELATKYVDADSGEWDRYLMRGEIYFRAAKIEESIKDFDKSIELNPRSEPYNWQRGISLYYAKRYEDGQKQFETHRRVNRNDVENSVWHFLCVAKQKGVEEARKGLIPIERDGRPPMMEVMRMFEGELSPEKVVAEAESPKLTSEGKAMAQFYGYLYVGLYYDALGESEKANLYLKKCLEQKTGGYMADVARVHLQLNKK